MYLEIRDYLVSNDEITRNLPDLRRSLDIFQNYLKQIYLIREFQENIRKGFAEENINLKKTKPRSCVTDRIDLIKDLGDLFDSADSMLERIDSLACIIRLTHDKFFKEYCNVRNSDACNDEKSAPEPHSSFLIPQS